MILNSYAVLLAFVAVLRFLLGLLVLGLGAAAWRSRGQLAADGREALEDRCYLVFLLALLLLGLNLASWPLLYLLLQSYVPEWPGVMCIYGVTQVGAGSLGPSRFLPDLLRLVQWTRPVLVFGGGAWFVLYLINRRTRTAPLLGRLFLVLLPLGALAALDSAADLAYVGIPKKEEFPSGGCCTVAFDQGARFLPESLVEDAGRPWLYAAYYGGNLGLALALFLFTRGLRRPLNEEQAPVLVSGRRLAGLLLGGAIVLAVSGVFLIEVAAPTLLGLPHHHCPYDLVPQVPEAVVAVTLFAGGCFFLGWAGVARWLGRCPETEPFLPGTVRGLLWLSLASYLASLAMLSVELALA
jgi:hypothetical protein